VHTFNKKEKEKRKKKKKKERGTLIVNGKKNRSSLFDQRHHRTQKVNLMLVLGL
jgi:hypothetical protein